MGVRALLALYGSYAHATVGRKVPAVVVFHTVEIPVHYLKTTLITEYTFFLMSVQVNLLF